MLIIVPLFSYTYIYIDSLRRNVYGTKLLYDMMVIIKISSTLDEIHSLGYNYILLYSIFLKHDSIYRHVHSRTHSFLYVFDPNSSAALKTKSIIKKTKSILEAFSKYYNTYLLQYGIAVNKT